MNYLFYKGIFYVFKQLTFYFCHDIAVYVQTPVCRECLRDIINMLRNTSNPQVEYITRIMKKWAKDNMVNLPS